MSKAAFSHASERTEAGSIPRRLLARTVVGMAHFAGTGPDGEICKRCTFYERPQGKQKEICGKYAKLTGDSKKPVPADAPACRYFERAA